METSAVSNVIYSKIPYRRRSFLKKGLLGAALVSSSRHHACAALLPSQLAPLWPPVAFSNENSLHPWHLSKNGALSAIRAPALNVFHPAQANGTVILIAAGGGYQRIGIAHEALPAVRWLTSLGITACVLIYRLPRESCPHAPSVPFEDAQRAVHLIRTNQIGCNFTPSIVGALGFSAGGHLLGIQGLHPDLNGSPTPSTHQILKDQLDIMMLLYPVVSFEPPFRTTRASLNLIGPHPTETERRRWSLPSYCHPNAPPLFIAHAYDDPIVEPQQAALLERHYIANQCPVERHLFSIGGHGFALGLPQTPPHAWPHLAEQWMKKNNAL